MAITPADIEKKTFSTALRGYDLDEVDDFLDEMVVAVRELEEELGRARARIAELEQGSGAVAAPATTSPGEAAAAPAPGIDESAVGRALVAAQQAADRILEEARTEAEKTVGDARSEADNFAREREQRRAAIEAEMADMTGLVAGVRTQLAVLATSVADKLDEMDAAVAGAHGTIAGRVDEEERPEPESEGRELYGEESEGTDDSAASPDEPTEPEGYVEDSDGGLALDIDDMDASEDDDQAGSSEIEGVLVDEEREEI
ncbi:MAG TPA: DivIVA domain-containing protein [Acidimicrobiia bacterium]|nr:DivIVA domain-containing protein [Acidimicrobiia bacterium]